MYLNGETMRIYWKVPHRVIYFKPADAATTQIIQQDNALLTSMLDDGIKPVHLIVDGSELRIIPRDIRQAQQINTFTSHPKIGIVVAVNVHKMHQIVGRFVARTTGLEIRFVETPNAAMRLLQIADPTLLEDTAETQP